MTDARIDALDADLARDSGVSVPALRAIRSVESGGNPRAVRFETRVFRERTGHTVEGSNRAAFERAYALNPLEAVNSTSWGWFQVMGFHGFPALYGGPAQAVRAFDADPEAVSLTLFKRWMSQPGRHQEAKEAAARLDFARFASIYNGCSLTPGASHPCDRYQSRMHAAYERALAEWQGVASGGAPGWIGPVLGALAGVGAAVATWAALGRWRP